VLKVFLLVEEASLLTLMHLFPEKEEEPFKIPTGILDAVSGCC
jgi:hypothetical protein